MEPHDTVPLPASLQPLSHNRNSAVAANTSLPIISTKATMEQAQRLPESPQMPWAVDEQKRSSRLQVAWNKAIGRNMEIPDGYAQVAVLIVEWETRLDSLKTREEVSELEKVFREEFNYEVQVLSLHEKPQYQLIGAMSAFLEAYDKPNNLLIVYYTGHSQWNKKTNELEFWSGNMEPFAPYVGWKTAEQLLMESYATSDVLAILDTCFAGNVVKGGLRNNRAYQLLAACGYNRDTAGPGKASFTAALIQALRQCLTQGTPFTVWCLMETINRMQFRRENPAHLHDRLGFHSRHIQLAALDRDKEKRKMTERQLIEHSGMADLTLRFNLGVHMNDFTDRHIEELTKRLPKLFSDLNLDLRRIDLESLGEHVKYARMRVPAMTMFWGRRWLKRARASSEANSLRHQRSVSDATRSDDASPSWTPPIIPSPIEAKTLRSVSLCAEASRTISSGLELTDYKNEHIFLFVFGTITLMNAVAHLYSFMR